MSVDSNVVRWMALGWDVITKAGVSQDRAPELLAALLCVMHKESRGVPTATNKKTKAWSLTQQMPRWFKDKWQGRPGDLRLHLEIWVRTMLDYLDDTGGYLPTAQFCWASGQGAVSHWVKTGTTTKGVTVKGQKKTRNFSWVPTHLAYIDHLYGELWPAYSAVVSGWLGAGMPLEGQGTVTVKGHANIILFPARVAVGAPMPKPYDGAHRISGYHRVFDPSEVQIAGAKPVTIGEAMASAQDALPADGGGAGFVVAGVAALAAAFIFREELGEVLA